MSRLDIEVEVSDSLQEGRALGIEWEWDVPPGFQIIGPSDFDGPCRLVVRVTDLGPVEVTTEEETRFWSPESVEPVSFTWDGSKAALAAILVAARASGLVCNLRGGEVALRRRGDQPTQWEDVWGAVIRTGTRITFHPDGAVTLAAEEVSR